MKKMIFVAILCAFSGAVTVNAQDVEKLVSKKSTALNREYLRPSLTKIYITDGTAEANAAVASLKSVVDEKFDYNIIDDDVYVMSGEIPELPTERNEKVKSFIGSLLSNEKIANQIIHCWYPTKDGKLTDEVLIERGQYAATDADVQQASASKLGRDALNILGEQMVDRSYILASFVRKVETVSTDKNGNKKVSVSVNIIPYLYKLDFSKEVMDKFYDNAYTPSGIDEMTFPTKFVKNANIGKKEGVSCDQRFAVMRMVEKDGQQKAQRVATVRASNKIIDNRGLADGIISKDQQTKFYEIKGRKVHEGETLVEDKDFGINVAAEYTMSEASVSIGYRIGKLLKVPGLSVYLKAGMPWSKGMGGIKILAYKDKDAFDNREQKSFQVFDASLGFAKEFNFAGCFALTAAVEGGYLFAPGAKGGDVKYDEKNNTWDEWDWSKNYDTKSYKIGASLKLGYYLTRNIQLYVNGGYNYFIKDDVFVKLQERWVESEKSHRHKFQKFQPLSIGGGINIFF